MKSENITTCDELYRSLTALDEQEPDFEKDLARLVGKAKLMEISEQDKWKIQSALQMFIPALEGRTLETVVEFVDSM